MDELILAMSPLQDNDHMVTKTAILERKLRFGTSKTKQVNRNCLCLDVPVGNLRSSMAVFVPCDHYPEKGPLSLVTPVSAGFETRCNALPTEHEVIQLGAGQFVGFMSSRERIR